MRKRLSILIVLASMVIVVFAMNLGVASAHGPEATAPVGSHIIPETAPGHPGVHNGFNWQGSGPDLTNPAVIGISHNPRCPLHHIEGIAIHPPGNQ